MSGVAILGMHRGGTSAVAGIVHRLGAFMGDNLLPPSRFNPLGYFEDAEVVALHDRLVGGWASPYTVMPQFGLLYDEYAAKIDEFQEHGFWAIKDPRLCFCLPTLLAIAPSTKVIMVFRDPWYAAHSLARREGFSFGAGIDLSLRYLESMIHNTLMVEKLRIRYIDIVLEPDKASRRIAKYIGVDYDPSVVEAIDPGLAHWEKLEALNIRGIS